jgi:hypothetical protein
VKRTLVLLEDRQYREILSLSRRTGRGVSELIRSAIDRLLKEDTTASPVRRLSDIRAIAHDIDGPSSSDHDLTLYSPA